MMHMDAKPATTPGFRSLWALGRGACLVALLGPTFAIALAGETPTAEVHDDFDVVIAGGGLIGRVIKVSDGEVEIELSPTVKVKALKGTLTDVRTRGAPAAANDAKS